MKMTRREFLCVSLGSVVSFLTGGCIKNENAQGIEKRKKFIGVVVDVDEDSIAISRSFFGEGVGEFHFEIYSLKDNSGKEIRLVYPGPNSVRSGDYLRIEYIFYENRKIPYEDIVMKGYKKEAHVIQKGYVNADGIITEITQISYSTDKS